MRIGNFKQSFYDSVVQAAKHSVDDIETDLFKILVLAQIGNCGEISSMLTVSNERYQHLKVNLLSWA